MIEKWSIQEEDGKGNIIRPRQLRRFPRFKGLFIYNGIFYVSIPHWLKWEAKSLWCMIRHQQHDFGGTIGSCSRCGTG